MFTKHGVGVALLLAGCAVDTQWQPSDGSGLELEDTVSHNEALRTPDDPLYDPREPIPGRPLPQPPAGPGLVPGEFSSIEDVPLWLIELEIATADVEDAGTDDPVTLRMKLRDGGVVDLNLGGDDRERGDTQRYIVNPWSVRRVRDIEQLELYKSGDDGWAIRSVALRVNNDSLPIFTRSFGASIWLDNDSGHSRNVVMGSAEMRAHSGWTLGNRTALLEPPAEISGSLIARMIEGAMGDALEEVPRIDFGTKYGPSYVEVERATDSVANVDLDLDDDNGIFRAIEIDTNFSVTWSCVAGNIDFQINGFTMPDIDLYFAEMQKGRFFRHVEDMLMRLRALTHGRPYRCSGTPSVRADGGIVTKIERKPTLGRFPTATVLQNAIKLDGVFADQFAVDPTIEDVPVWSVHVETETADVSDAGTDDSVYLSLTDALDYYGLARNADNRERGAVERYLVTIPNVRRVADIKRLDFRNISMNADGWCVQRVALFINDDPVPLYEQRFNQCRWVDGDGGDDVTPLTISSVELRADPRWSLTNRPNIWQPGPNQLTPSYLRTRLENPILAMVGGMSGTKLEDCANLKCIEIERGSGRSVAIHFKYYRELSLASDEHFEVDFDLAFRCVDGRLKVDARNMIRRDFDSTSSIQSHTDDMNAFGDAIENNTLIRRCTAEPQVVDYGNTFLNLSAQ